ncbi:hypothetical protein AAF712_002606 [Marasmius tenuissimus]|uniref:Uncharacterized protein n=1 Tax=Marasmius tenuissimus TaxID=585030 RepID=A0ABR3AAV6_9AGAR
MSEEPTVVGTEPQGVLDSSAPHKDPAVVLEGEDAGEESDTYDDFDAEVPPSFPVRPGTLALLILVSSLSQDNRDGDEDAGGEEYNPNEDGEDDEDDEEDEETGPKKSNLTALLLNDPEAGGYVEDDEDAEDGGDDGDEDGDYAEDADADEAEYEAETVPVVHANGNGKKRPIDDVNSEDGGVEADEREVAAKKVKA